MAFSAPPVSLFAIQAVEDSFVAKIQASPIAPYLRAVMSLPGDLTPAEIGERLRVSPGAFVSFGGGPGRPTLAAGIEARVSVFVVTGQGAKEEDRRRGSKVTIGAYSLVQAVAMVLHGKMLPVPSVDGTPICGLKIGAPSLQDIARYWSPDVDAAGLTIYGADFTLAVTFPPDITEDDLTPFAEFLGQIVTDGVPEGASAPLPSDEVAAEDMLELPQD